MDKGNIQQRYMSVEAAARYLGMSESALRYKLDVRRLPYAKIGKTVRLDRLELDKFIAENAIAPIDLQRRG